MLIWLSAFHSIISILAYHHTERISEGAIRRFGEHDGENKLRLDKFFLVFSPDVAMAQDVK